MLNISRTPRFSKRVPEHSQAKKSQIVIENMIYQSGFAIELRDVLHKRTEGIYIPHSTVWRIYDGVTYKDVTVKKGTATVLWDFDEGDVVTLIVKEIDDCDRVECGLIAEDWVTIERMDLEKGDK